MVDIALVIFDLAGTTIVDDGQVPEAFTTVLRAQGIELSAEALRSVRGASKREAIRHFLARQGTGSEAELAARSEQVFAEFRRCLAQVYARRGIQAMPGAAQTFAWLRARGVQVALNTGFDRATTGLLLHAVGWESATVDAVVCGDDVPQGRPAPYLIFHAMQACRVLDVRRVANVGDTLLDLQAGWNAAAGWNIGVLSGAHTRQQLETGPYTHLLTSVAELPALWG